MLTKGISYVAKLEKKTKKETTKKLRQHIKCSHVVGSGSSRVSILYGFGVTLYMAHLGPHQNNRNHSFRRGVDDYTSVKNYFSRNSSGASI